MKLGLILGAVSLFAASLFGAEDCAKFVDVKIGTAGTGHTYPGVVAPFGMVQPSPETGYSTWRYCSGYHNDDKRILSFGQTHLSGTGCPDSGDAAQVRQSRAACLRWSEKLSITAKRKA